MLQRKVAGFGVAVGVSAGRTACETQAATKMLGAHTAVALFHFSFSIFNFLCSRRLDDE